MAEPICNGMCVTAADVGVMGYGDAVAYGHPMCPVHGWGDDAKACPANCGGSSACVVCDSTGFIVVTTKKEA